MIVRRLWLAALMAELLTVVASKSMMGDFINHSRSVPNTTTPRVDLIPLDVDVKREVTESKRVVYFLIPQVTDQNVYVTVSPIKATINWKLKYLPQLNSKQIILGNNRSSDSDKELTEYTGVSILVTYDCKARRGLYEITARTVSGTTDVMFRVTLRKRIYFPPNEIDVQNKGDRGVYVSWNPSHVDQHKTTYDLVISTSRTYSTYPEAKRQLEEKQNFTFKYSTDNVLTGDRLEIHRLEYRTNYTLTDLVYDQTYYFTVFAVNENNKFTLHANATFTYRKPKPIALKDARPWTVELRAQNGKASFRYKVGNRSREPGAEPNTLYWYVMPCDGVVNVEIRNRKTILVQKRVFGYEKLVLNDTKFGERYVLKVETVSPDETQQVKSVEVMATVRPRMFPMPDMPSDLSVRQYAREDDCHSVTIGWLPAKSDTGLLYCVYLQQVDAVKNGLQDSVAKQDQCAFSVRSNKRREQYRRTRCWHTAGAKELVSVEKVLKLKSSTTYDILVTVTKPRGRTLAYDRLRLDTNSCGLNN